MRAVLGPTKVPGAVLALDWGLQVAVLGGATHQGSSAALHAGLPAGSGVPPQSPSRAGPYAGVRDAPDRSEREREHVQRGDQPVRAGASRLRTVCQNEVNILDQFEHVHACVHIFAM